MTGGCRMKLLFTNTTPINVGNYVFPFVANFRAESDGELLYLTASYMYGRVYNGAVEFTVTYNGDTRTVKQEPFSSQVFVFPYSEDVSSFTVWAPEIYYRSVKYTDGYTFTWHTSMDGTDPELTLSVEPPRCEMTQTISWKATDPLGRPVYVIGLTAHHFAPGDYDGDWEIGLHYSTRYDAESSRQINILSTQDLGKHVYYKATAAVYETADDEIDDYIGVTEFISPVYVYSQKYSPYAPFDIQYKTPVVRVPMKITWQSMALQNYPAKAFQLERSVNGGEFTLVYEGASTAFADTIPEGTETVAYRVRVSENVTTQYIVGRTLEAVLSNLYIAGNGELRIAAGLYLGENGAVKQVTPLIEVGRS